MTPLGKELGIILPALIQIEPPNCGPRSFFDWLDNNVIIPTNVTISCIDLIYDDYFGFLGVAKAFLEIVKGSAWMF